MIKNFTMVLDFTNDLKNNLQNIEIRNTYIMSLYSYERMWQVFLSGLTSDNGHLILKNLVRKCLDMLWNKAIYNKENIEDYTNTLGEIDELSLNHELSKGGEELYDSFLNQFPPYLINELYSNIISESSTSQNMYYSYISCGLMMLSDIAEDKDYDINSQVLIDNEVKRIYDDMEFLCANSKDIDRIISRKNIYQNLLII